MNERIAFLEEIKNDPENTSVRAIFADWLDEHDEPEQADFYRSWTLEAYKEGKEYLEDLALRITEEGKDYHEDGDYEFTYDKLLEGLKKAFESYDSTYLNFQTPDFLYEEREKMWEAFSVVTSQRVKEDAKSNSPFRCGC
jgi:uncharacterized protein (TIGR02996 family)